MLVGRLAFLPLFLVLVIYPFFAWVALRRVRSTQNIGLFTLVNLLGAYAACAAVAAGHVDPHSSNVLKIFAIVAMAFLCYAAIVVVNYWLLWQSQKGSRWSEVLVFTFPISMLILIKYVPPVDTTFWAALHRIAVTHLSVLFVGLSYVTFRLIYLAYEVRNKLVTMPSLTEYLGYSFFVPILSTGPVSPYSSYIRSIQKIDRERTPVLRSFTRIAIGLTKYIFLSSLLNQLTYSGLLRDGHPHHTIDLFIAAFAYTFYLYCNFSGFCDMVIGVSGLLGIEIMENFNQPFASRNLQEFWTKWHISLSTVMRDLLFEPLVNGMAKFFGPKHPDRLIVASLLITFVLIGMWHGVGTNFVIFGLWHGIGLAIVYRYAIFLKAKLGDKGYMHYRQSRPIQYASTVITFLYLTASLFFFANSWEQMRDIFKSLV